MDSLKNRLKTFYQYQKDQKHNKNKNLKKAIFEIQKRVVTRMRNSGLCIISEIKKLVSILIETTLAYKF